MRRQAIAHSARGRAEQWMLARPVANRHNIPRENPAAMRATWMMFAGIDIWEAAGPVGMSAKTPDKV
ncbi:hypothetical protein [Mesorhizobium sp. NFR06]|jgi:hypothetical protein|uniref:hypothetical protein n=1 Tax=Mesorhizobium sp. NFR06 TaxID=1566290 RepID=UPI00165F9464|nr:hypothetical protein [Mesorhizobium sp. NFR06]